MLKFLRKIRKSLIESLPTREGTAEQVDGSARKPASPFGRYLIYAVGEILLVMIGILLALQVNNWNEKIKLRTTEIKILKELETALNDDLRNLKINVRSYKNVKRSLEIIKEQLPLAQPTNDSLAYAFRMSLFNNSVSPTMGPYETLKSKGLDLISNDTLRQDIIAVYEVAYKYYQDRAKNELLPESYIQEYCAGLFKGLGNRKDDPEAMIPIDYAVLQKDQTYRTIINTRLAQVHRSNSRLELNRNLVEELINRIKKELSEEY